MKTKSTLIVSAIICFVTNVPAWGAGQDVDRVEAVSSKAVSSVGASAQSATGQPLVNEAADNSQAVSPPARPKAITTEQLAALEKLADNPEFSVSPDTRAGFSPKVAKRLDDLSGPGFYAGYGATLLWLLIAAAPL